MPAFWDENLDYSGMTEVGVRPQMSDQGNSDQPLPGMYVEPVSTSKDHDLPAVDPGRVHRFDRRWSEWPAWCTGHSDDVGHGCA
jgi:hypothetical protein